MENWKENNVWHGLSMNTIYNMDCIEWMKLIPDWSIDCIITDPPYWTTACKWDNVIPFEPMWEQLKRIIKPNWAIVLFGSQPFTSALVMSNPKWFKYEWIWEKAVGSNFATLKYQPMKEHENILVFSKGTHKYFPILQGRKGGGSERIKYNYNASNTLTGETTGSLKNLAKNKSFNELRNPSSVQYFNNREKKRGLHPTQKPVALIEYLIRTYTNEWETVLDFTIWSWTTAIACINTGRNYIWFELDEWYYNIANKRIQDRLSEK